MNDKDVDMQSERHKREGREGNKNDEGLEDINDLESTAKTTVMNRRVTQVVNDLQKAELSLHRIHDSFFYLSKGQAAKISHARIFTEGVMLKRKSIKHRWPFYTARTD